MLSLYFLFYSSLDSVVKTTYNCTSIQYLPPSYWPPFTKYSWFHVRPPCPTLFLSMPILLHTLSPLPSSPHLLSSYFFPFRYPIPSSLRRLYSITGLLVSVHCTTSVCSRIQRADREIGYLCTIKIGRADTANASLQ